MQHFINIQTCPAKIIKELIDRSNYWKSVTNQGPCNKILHNKTIGMIFEKPSTRTRIAFEVAITKLGGTSLFLNSKDLQLSRNEPIKDTARVLNSYLDGLVIRTYKHDVLDEFIKYSNIPIINGLSEQEHPCQTIADLLTMQELLGNLAGKKIVFVGRYNNVSHSLMMGSLKMGMTFALLIPTNDCPNTTVLEQAQEIAKNNNGNLLITQDIKEALTESSIIYTDVWQSMGDETQLNRINLMCYQINSNLLKQAEKDIKVMHCLPAKRNEEITDEVLESHQKTIFQQADNKLYSHMAILEKFVHLTN